MNSPRRFAAPIWFKALLFLGMLVSCAFTILGVREEGWSLLNVGLCLSAVLAVAGFAEALFCRVELHPERLVVVSNFRKREYSRIQFKRVTWEKGTPVALELLDGGWLLLPAFVGGGPGVLSAFRSWMRGGKRAA
jgi:hypothetical protein